MANFQDSWRSGGTGRGNYTLVARTATETPLTIQLAASATADGFLIENSAGTDLFKVDPSGNITIAGSVSAVISETLTGDISLTGNLTVNGNTTLGNAASDTLTVTATPTFSQLSTFASLLRFSGSAAVNDNNYEIGRDNDNNNLRRNVPNTAQHEFTVQGSTRVTISETTFAVNSNSVFGGAMTVNGTLNVSGIATFLSTPVFRDGIFLPDDETIHFGNTAASPDIRLGWNTSQTVDALYLGLSDAQNTFIIAENGDRAFDFAHGAATNPTLFIHSAAQSTTQWISLAHNQTNAVITAGAGSLVLNPASGMAVLINDTTERSVDGSHLFEISTSADIGGASFHTWSATAGQLSSLDLNRSKSATIGTQTIVASGDSIGRIMYRGSDGVAFIQLASISALVDGTPGVNDMPGRLVFSTTADGQATVTDRLILDSAGVLKPNANDGVALGTTALSYSDLFLASGAVINWVAGDVTLTHAAGKLTFGGDGAVEIDFNNHEMTNVDIDSGAIDGTTIGATSTSTGAFTTLSGSTAGNVLTLTNSTDSASVQVGIIQGDRATMADGDNAYITLSLSDSAGNQDEQARIGWTATTVLNGATQDGDLILSALVNGALTTMLTMDGSANEIVPAVAINSAAAITGSNITASTNFLPDADNGAGLGISGTAFSDLFLASGAVINFNAGDVTITHAADKLTFAAAANGYDFNLSSATTTPVVANSVRLANANTTLDNGSFILFDVTRTTPGQFSAGAIGAVSAADTNNGSLVFYADLTGTLTEYMRIIQSGNVGIGTTSPDYLLEVEKNQNAVTSITVKNTTDGIANAAEFRMIGDGTREGNLFLSGTSYTGVAGYGDALVMDANASTLSGIIISAAATNADIKFYAGGRAAGDLAMMMTDAGKVLIGSITTALTIVSTIPHFQIEGTDGAIANMSITRNSANNAPPIFNFAKTRGAANNDNTIVADDDELGKINFAGADGVDKNSIGARISAFVDGTPGIGDMPGRLEFLTTADGASNSTLRLTIDSTGNILIADAGGLVVGHTAQDTSSGAAHEFQVLGTAFADSSGGFFRYSNDANPSGIAFSKSRGTTLISDGIVSADDDLGIIIADGNDGSNFIRAASITFAVDGAPGLTDMPGRIEFATTLNGAAAVTQRMAILNTGSVVIGGSTNASSNFIGLSPLLEVNSTGTGRVIGMETWSADANGGYFQLGKSRGATIGTYTAPNSGDTLGTLSFSGADATATRFEGGAQISAITAEAWSDTAHGAHLVLYTVPATSETVTQRMTILSSGVVTIGGTLNTAYGRLGQLFETNVTANYGGTALNTWSATAAEAALIDFNRSKSATIGTHTLVASGDVLGRVAFRGSDGAQFTAAAHIEAQVDGTAALNDMPGRLIFATTADGATSSTERLRIDNAGVVGTGAAAFTNVTTVGTMVATGGFAVGDVLASWIDDATHGAGSTAMLIGNQTITVSSDVRIKENITDTKVNAIDILSQLRVVDFNWKENFVAHEAYNKRGTFTGLIAQEAVGIVPTIFNTQGGGECSLCLKGVECSDHLPWHVQYEYLVPTIIKGVQELSAEIVELKKEIAKLKK